MFFSHLNFFVAVTFLKSNYMKNLARIYHDKFLLLISIKRSMFFSHLNFFVAVTFLKSNYINNLARIYHDQNQ